MPTDPIPTGEAVPHGVIALDPGACPACLVCVRECPVWCITITSHDEPDASGDDRRPRTKTLLDKFEIDFGLCMYCGICVDTCPFDALSWQALPNYPADLAQGLKHGIAELDGWRQR